MQEKGEVGKLGQQLRVVHSQYVVVPLRLFFVVVVVLRWFTPRKVPFFAAVFSLAAISSSRFSALGQVVSEHSGLSAYRPVERRFESVLRPAQRRQHSDDGTPNEKRNVERTGEKPTNTNVICLGSLLGFGSDICHIAKVVAT